MSKNYESYATYLAIEYLQRLVSKQRSKQPKYHRTRSEFSACQYEVTICHLCEVVSERHVNHKAEQSGSEIALPNRLHAKRS